MAERPRFRIIPQGTPHRSGSGAVAPRNGRFRAWVFLASLLFFAAGVHAAAPQADIKNPKWSQLNAQQQGVLEPLAGEWDNLDGARKKKWLGIAKSYPKMSAKERERAQARMNEWVRLSPEQRRDARENYKRLVKKLPPEKRQALGDKWAEYQALPAEERQSHQPQPEPAGGKRRAKSAAPAAD